MLVLSRRINERILLPTVNVSIQIVGVKPGVVRLGVEAPRSVPVLREEIVGRDSVVPSHADPAMHAKELNHLLRNCLNSGSVGLTLLKQQLSKGMTMEAEATLARMQREFLTQQERLERIHPIEAAETKPKQARQALLVEDDATQCELLAGLLRLSGMEVATAGDGRSALDHLETHTPDFLLLDMLMPHCDGPTMLSKIRQNQGMRGMKIFALSGHAPERFNLDPLKAGITRWFRKPIKPEMLIRTLQEDLDAN